MCYPTDASPNFYCSLLYNSEIGNQFGNALLKLVLNLLMCRDIKKQIGILRSRIFRSMGSGKGQDHHDRFVRSPLLGLSEESQGIVGDQIREIITGVVPSVSDFVPIDVDRVVVEARISH